MVESWKSAQSALRLPKHVKPGGLVTANTRSFLYTEIAPNFVGLILTITHGQPFPDSLQSYPNTQNDFGQGLIHGRFGTHCSQTAGREEGVPDRGGL